MLGFDAIGRPALGQLPRNVFLPGTFTLNGVAATFTITAPETVGSFALSGVAQSFTTTLAPAPGAFALTGVAATFTIVENVSVGGYVLTGMPVTGQTGNIFETGVFALTGIAATSTTTFSQAGAASFTITGETISFTRDFVNWLAVAGLGAPAWSADAAPSPGWTPISPPSPTWTADAAPSPGWTPVSPPSNTWTVDSAQLIPPPVTE